LGIPNLAFCSDIGAKQIQTMSFHRSKLEMNRRLDFRTGEGCLRQEAVCFGSEAVVGRLRNQEQLTITGNSALLVASDRITLNVDCCLYI